MASTNKTGRNVPCPCGSGKKFKKCCGQATTTGGRSHSSELTFPLDVREEPLEHLWNFGNVKVIHGDTNDLFRDEIMSEDRVKGLLGEMHNEMSASGWTPAKAPNIFFGFDDRVAEEWSSRRPSFDPFGERMRAGGESIPLGFNDVFQVDISGVEVNALVVLYPNLIKAEMLAGNRINVLHTLCHEFSHAFGLTYRKGSEFNATSMRYWEFLADYFSLTVLRRSAAWLETSDLHRQIYYLSAEFQNHHGYKATSNAHLGEFAEQFLREAGVLPCPKELWGVGEIGFSNGGAS
jgi:hypothetical protein